MMSFVFPTPLQPGGPWQTHHKLFLSNAACARHCLVTCRLPDLVTVSAAGNEYLNDVTCLMRDLVTVTMHDGEHDR